MAFKSMPANNADLRFASDTLVTLPLPSVNGIYWSVFTVDTADTAAKVFVFFVAIIFYL